jgi:phage-related protein
VSDIQTLSASLTGDTASFDAAMDHAAQKSAAFEAGVGHAEESVKHFGHAGQEAGEEHVGAIGMAVEAYHLAAEAVAKVVESLEGFAEAAVEAANEMDPAGAIRWTASVEGLKSSFQTFAGTIGREVMPAVEGMMNGFAKGFDHLAQLDWRTIFDSLISILELTGRYVETWGTKVLDFLSYPFRQLVGIVEQSLAGVMAAIGTVVAKLGDTSIGKKLGLGEYSADALNQTAADMFKQADAFRESFGSAAKEVGAGLAFSLDAAVKAAGGSSAMASLKAALSGVGSGREGGEKVETAQQLGMRLTAYQAELQAEQDRFTLEQQADAHHIAQIRQAASEAKQAAVQQVDIAKAAEAAALAKLAADQSAGNVFAIGDDQKALAAALTQLTTAGAAATAAANKAAGDESAIAADLETRKAAALDAYAKSRAAAVAADAAAAAAPGNGVLQLLKQEADARAAMDDAHKNALVGAAESAEQAASRLRSQGTREAATITTAAATEAAKIQAAAAQKAADFYTKTASALAQHALGGVGGGALAGAQAGFAAAGPLGAAAGAGASLLENSAGFKQFADALNTLFQSLADAVGQLLGPLVPVVRQIGAALKPLIDTLGQVFGAAGRMLAATLTPLVPVIAMVSKLLADILEPVALLMNAIQPLIPIIVMINELMLALSATAFVPLIIAIKALKPVLDLVAGVLQAITNAIADVWNSIIGAIQSVIRGIANVLPDKLGGNALRDFADGMDALKVHTNAAAQAVSAFADGVIAATATIDAATQGPANTVNAATTYNENDAVLREYFDLMVKLDEKRTADAARGTSSAADAAADAADKAYASASAKYNADADKQRADAAYQDYVQAVNQFGISSQQAADAYAKYYKAQADYNADQAAASDSNTAATAANTTATIALNTTMSNVPQGFKVAAYEYASANDAGGDTVRGGSTASRAGSHHPARDASDSLEAALAGGIGKEAPGVRIGGHLFQIATMQIIANNPEELRKELEIASKRSNYLSAGLPVVSVSGHF